MSSPPEEARKVVASTYRGIKAEENITLASERQDKQKDQYSNTKARPNDQTSQREKEKEKEEKEKDIPMWNDGVDRFTNFVTKEQIMPDVLINQLKKKIIRQ